MRMNFLTSTAIAALMVTGAVASAQQSSSPGASGPSTTQASPSTGGSSSNATSPGPSSGGMKGDSSGAKSGSSAETRTGGSQGQERAEQKSPNGHAGEKAAQSDNKTEGGKAAQRDERNRKDSDRTGQAQRESDKAGASKSGDAREKTTPSGQRDRAQNTGAASTSVTINTEQRTRVKQHIGELRVGRVDRVDFSISVGTVVPRTVTLHVIPASIVEVVPAWRRYRFIMVGDEILIVDPDTLRIIAVVEA